MLSDIKIASGFKIVALFLVAISCWSLPASGQTLPDPQRTTTLNGLTVLIDNRNTGPNVTLSLRIQAGAAFDLSGKSGTMATLADLLFPDQTTHEFIADELKGKLETRVTQDTVDIVMSGSAAEFERLVQFLRTALAGRAFTDADFDRIKAERIKSSEQQTKSEASIANQAVLDRLYGTFPYARPVDGTPTTLGKMQVGDIIFARERFLNPNNAVLVVSGGIDSDRVMRALRQLLGLWRKSETLIKQSFRQPSAPDDRLLIVPASGSNVEVRLALKGLARGNKDFHASAILAEVLKAAVSRNAGKYASGPVSVSYDQHQLPGAIIIGATTTDANAPLFISAIRKEILSRSTSGASGEEFDQARNFYLEQLRSQASTPEGLAKLWLDAETFGLASLQSQVDQIQAITPSDLGRTAARLFKDQPITSVAVGDPAELSKILSSSGDLRFEVKSLPVSPTSSGKPLKP